MKLKLGQRVWIRAYSTHPPEKQHIEAVVVGFRERYTEFDEFPSNDQVFFRDDATNHVYDFKEDEVFLSLEDALRYSISNAEQSAVRAFASASEYRGNAEAWRMQLMATEPALPPPPTAERTAALPG